MIQQNADIDIIKVDAKSALYQPQINAGEMIQIIDKKYQAKAALAKTYVKAVADIQALFNDNQKEKIKNLWIEGFAKSGCTQNSKKSNCPTCLKGSSKGSGGKIQIMESG